MPSVEETKAPIVETLHAETDTVHAELSEVDYFLLRDVVGIRFEGDFRKGRQHAVAVNSGKNRFHFLIVELRRGSSSKVERGNGSAIVAESQFFGEGADESITFLFAMYGAVETTIDTPLFAKGNVNV